jgi:hypothetical protein
VKLKLLGPSDPHKLIYGMNEFNKEQVVALVTKKAFRVSHNRDMITCSKPVRRNPVHKVIKPALSSQGKLLDLDSEAFRFPHKSSSKFMATYQV